MKIVAINGSPRTIQGMTRRLAGFVLEGAEEHGAATEMIDLCDLRVVPCTACEACGINGVCVNDDDIPQVIARMREADGIIFASPVYIDNVTGQMKIFFDRLADAIHYQVLAGRYGCSVATTHESGGDAVTAYLDHVLNYLGVVSVGRIAVATRGDAGAIDAREADARALGASLAGAITAGFHDSSQEAEIAGNRAYFRPMVTENRYIRSAEYEDWKKKGWLD